MRKTDWLNFRAFITICAIGLMGTTWVIAQKPSGKLPGVELPEPRAIKTPLVAQWPSEISGLLQARKYSEARAFIDRLETSKPPADAQTRAFHDLVRGLSLRLEGKLEESVALIEKRLKADPETAWTAKLRGELASAKLLSGKPAEAQALARADVERLLSGTRKDSLANVYRGFARQLLEPSEILISPDYAAAKPFLEQALEVAENQTLKDDLTYQLARLSLDQGAPADAIDELDRLVKQEKRPDRKRSAHFDLGLAQYRAGDFDLARRTWSDLARELEMDAPKDPKAAAMKADCLYASAMSYGLMIEWELELKPNVASTPVRPFPVGNAQYLSRVVAATEKALKADPSNPRAVRSSFVLGTMLAQKPAEAVLHWQKFLSGTSFKEDSETARKDLAKFKPEAAFKLAESLRAIEKYDEAQASFLDYSKKYPDGSNSAQAIQAAIDIEIDRANKRIREKNYSGFRDSIKQFVASNPLQPSVPRLLFRVGDSFAIEKNWKEAVAAWKMLVARFPSSIEADEARYQTALAYENQIGDLALAIETYRTVVNEPWRNMALQRVSIMENKSLAVITPRVFRSNETAKLKISTSRR